MFEVLKSWFWPEKTGENHKRDITLRKNDAVINALNELSTEKTKCSFCGAKTLKVWPYVIQMHCSQSEQTSIWEADKHVQASLGVCDGCGKMEFFIGTTAIHQANLKLKKDAEIQANE